MPANLALAEFSGDEQSLKTVASELSICYISVMTLKNYIKNLTKDELDALAKRAETSPAYLLQLAKGHRKAGSKTLFALVSASNGELTPELIRPDLIK